MPLDYTWTILAGGGLTLLPAFAALLLSCVPGMAAALAKRSNSRPLRLAAEAYTFVVRGIPGLVMILLVFYSLPALLNQMFQYWGLDWRVEFPPLATGIVTLGLIFGAYMTETFRFALENIPHGQIEAARAFGIPPLAAARRILLPAMLTRALPLYGNLPYDKADAAGNRHTICEAAGTIVSRGAVPVLLGGDDSIPIPMIDALSATGRQYTIVQIDAHIDRIIQVGARGIGSARVSDRQDALRWGAHLFPARQLERDGIGPVLDMIPDGCDVILCFDADALDSSVVPVVIARSGRGRIAALDFVEFMPERDIDGIGALSFARVIASALGILARQCDAEAQ